MLRIPGRAFAGLLIIVLLTLTGSLRTSFAASLAPLVKAEVPEQKKEEEDVDLLVVLFKALQRGASCSSVCSKAASVERNRWGTT